MAPFNGSISSSSKNLHFCSKKTSTLYPAILAQDALTVTRPISKLPLPSNGASFHPSGKASKFKCTGAETSGAAANGQEFDYP
jgi:hypothetical protein